MTCEKLDSDFSATILAMIVSLRHFLGWLVSAFQSREDLALENLALRRLCLAKTKSAFEINNIKKGM
jgi:hypothetical protein